VLSPPRVKRDRHASIVEHQSNGGLVWRPPFEHVNRSRVQTGEMPEGSRRSHNIHARAYAPHLIAPRSRILPTPAPAARANRHSCSAGGVLVAHVFKEAGDWDAGELIVKPTAVKPWRQTRDGMISMRVLDGSAWLYMETDLAEDGDGGEEDVAAPAANTSRLLCQGDWVCIPPQMRYKIGGCAIEEGDGEAPMPPPPAFHAVFFARAYADSCGETRWDLYEGGASADGKRGTPRAAAVPGTSSAGRTPSPK
jgi:hypothetical protein